MKERVGDEKLIIITDTRLARRLAGKNSHGAQRRLHYQHRWFIIVQLSSPCLGNSGQCGTSPLLFSLFWGDGETAHSRRSPRDAGLNRPTKINVSAPADVCGASIHRRYVFRTLDTLPNRQMPLQTFLPRDAFRRTLRATVCLCLRT